MGLSFAILLPHADSNNNFAYFPITPGNSLLHYPAQAGGVITVVLHACWVGVTSFSFCSLVPGTKQGYLNKRDVTLTFILPWLGPFLRITKLF